MSVCTSVCLLQLDEAMRQVVSGRLRAWYLPLTFHNGSILTTTGFTILQLLNNHTIERLKDSIVDTLLQANQSFIVDRNSIIIARDLGGKWSLQQLINGSIVSVFI